MRSRLETGMKKKTNRYLYDQWQVGNSSKLPTFTAAKSREELLLVLYQSKSSFWPKVAFAFSFHPFSWLLAFAKAASTFKSPTKGSLTLYICSTIQIYIYMQRQVSQSNYSYKTQQDCTANSNKYSRLKHMVVQWGNQDQITQVIFCLNIIFKKNDWY